PVQGNAEMFRREKRRGMRLRLGHGSILKGRERARSRMPQPLEPGNGPYPGQGVKRRKRGGGHDEAHPSGRHAMPRRLVSPVLIPALLLASATFAAEGPEETPGQQFHFTPAD